MNYRQPTLPKAINAGTEVRISDATDHTITIRSSILYWFILYKTELLLFPAICFTIFLLPVESSDFPIEMGYTLFLLIQALLGLYTFFLLIKAIWGFIKLSCIKWKITKEEIMVTRGVFTKCTDHTELYRVCDYQSSSTFFESLLGFCTYTITSTDTNVPVIYIFGIHKNEPLLTEIRRRVEEQKKNRHIYEIANH